MTVHTVSWLTGSWEACSASCGQTGWRRRWVSCQQESSSGKQQRSVNSRLCGEDRPESKQTCNRFPCPAAWRAGPWTPVRRSETLWSASDLVLSELQLFVFLINQSQFSSSKKQTLVFLNSSVQTTSILLSDFSLAALQ